MMVVSYQMESWMSTSCRRLMRMTLTVSGQSQHLWGALAYFNPLQTIV